MSQPIAPSGLILLRQIASDATAFYLAHPDRLKRLRDRSELIHYIEGLSAQARQVREGLEKRNPKP